MPSTEKKHEYEIDPLSLTGLESFRSRSVLDHMSDMYSFPDTLPDTIGWQTVYTGGGGFARDAQNIREYFRKAIRKAEV